MATFHLVGVAVLVLLLNMGTSSVNGKIPWKPTITSSQTVVQESATGLELNCIGFTYDNKTKVLFSGNGAQIFDSTTNKTGRWFLIL